MTEINVGVIGGGFMAQAHSISFATMPMYFDPAPAIPVRKAIADINLELATKAKNRFGYKKAYGDWRELIADPEVDAVSIVTPNHLHAEISIAAAKAGKHILCEKPLARTSQEARLMLEAVEEAGVHHMVAFNFRKTPAVYLAKKFIDEGRIGKVLSFQGTYFQEDLVNPSVPLSWRFYKESAGSGILGDIGAHTIDMARFLVGEFYSVNAQAKTWTKKRPIQPGSAKKGEVEVDDEVSFLINFENGAIGSIEATKNAPGRKNFITFEIHGEKGTICFNFERMNELEVCFADDPAEIRGFRTIQTSGIHPYGELSVAGIGYMETKIAIVHDFFSAIMKGTKNDADFRDGYQNNVICDAVLESAKRQEWVEISSINKLLVK
ncbi:Gfo/Idh/MocA family protein [Bacillus rugosus]|uniref:Gfo/Idh/MocA family protein n=1 Tax=Bacillus rugosus TaxID=2715209 RepID=UPI0035A39F48